MGHSIVSTIKRTICTVGQALAILLALPVHAANTPVQQSGTVTPGHGVMWTTSGVVQDSGSAINGKFTELGVTKPGGCAIGINSGVNTGPYAQICLGVGGSGAFLSVNSFGGAPGVGLFFEINGQTYPFPGAGGGNVLGPNSSVDGDTAVFNGNSGTLLKDGGPPQFSVPTNAALVALSLTGRVAGYTVVRNGYYAVGGSIPSLYTLQTAPCSLNAGAGDGGSQVQTGSSCWILGNQTTYDPRQWGATGSATTAVGTWLGSTSISFDSTATFAVGQHIRIPLAGSVFTISAPTSLNVTSTQKASFTGVLASGVLTASAVSGLATGLNNNIVPGAILQGAGVTPTTITGLQAGAGGREGGYTTSGSQTLSSEAMNTVPGASQYCYRVAAFTKDEGVGVAAAEACASDGATTLGLAHDLGAPAAGEVVAWTAPAGSPDGYVIYGNRTGAEAAIAVVDATQTSFTDYGHVQPIPAWIPSAPLASSHRGRLLTTISAINNNIVTIANSAASVFAVPVTHDDTIPISNALATGLPISVTPGQYDITGPLAMSANAQNLQFADRGSAILHGFGCYDMLTFSAADQNTFDVGMDASDMACGNAEFANGVSNFHSYRTQINNAYNGVAETAQNRARMENLNFKGEHRGQYGVYVYNANGALNPQLATFDDLQTANSWTATSIHIDGDVASTFIRSASSVQPAVEELIIDNAIGAPNFPHFVQFWDSALNNCNDACVKIFGTTSQVYFVRPYLQGATGNQAPVVQTSTGSQNINFEFGDVFSGDRGGIVFNGNINNLSDTNVYGNSVSVGGFPDILCASTSVGCTIKPGTNFTPSSGSLGTPSQSAVYIQSGATNVSVVPGSGNGRLGCNIINLTGPANITTIAGQNRGSPADTLDTASGGDNLLVATYPNLYKGIDGLSAKLCRSGPVIAHNDQLDTAANILAAIPNDAPGTSFTINYSSAVNAVMTITGNTGITVNGTATVGPSGGNGNIVELTLHCIVQAGGTTIACNGTPG